jgi:hypothetical protein
MKAKASWSFTAKPDFARICRELEEAGCPVALVQLKAGGCGKVTLVNFNIPWPAAALRPANGSPVVGKSDWRVYPGDRVKAFLEVETVSVDGFAGPVQPKADRTFSVHSGPYGFVDVIVGAPAPKAERWGLFVVNGAFGSESRSQDYPEVYPSETAALDAVPAQIRTIYIARRLP